MIGRFPLTLEEISKIRETIGSLYQVIEECIVLSFEDNGDTRSEFLSSGSIVALLEYYPKPIGWVAEIYDFDAKAKVLTESGFIGDIEFSSLRSIKAQKD